MSEQKFLDIKNKNQCENEKDFRQLNSKTSFKTVLFSRGKKTEKFFTEDSHLYITPWEQEQLRRGIKLDRKLHKWDSLSSRIVNDFVYHSPSQASLLKEALERRYMIFNESLSEASDNFLSQFSVVRLWNLSIIGSILFGMVTMTFVYRYLGQGASADQLRPGQQVAQQEQLVLGAEDSSDDAESFAKQVAEIQQARDQKMLEREIMSMVKGHPIEKMVPYIAKQDRTVAAFIVAIARKESGWGEHVPVLDGNDCYNYWGYRGLRDRMGTGGHTCFNSPQDAVNTVAKRIKTLVEDNGRNTPEKMVVWKCGGSCAATGGQAAANKWVSDVDTIFNKLNKD